MVNRRKTVKKILPIIAVVVLLMLFMAPAASAAPPAWGGDCSGVHHCVQWGETLHSIGRMYNKDPQFLAQVNGLWNPNRIFAGQILYIPPDGPPYPWFAHRPVGCFDWGCGDYGQPRPTPYYGHGYDNDYTGYYYQDSHPQYKRYSYTCDNYNNCY